MAVDILRITLSCGGAEEFIYGIETAFRTLFWRSLPFAHGSGESHATGISTLLAVCLGQSLEDFQNGNIGISGIIRFKGLHSRLKVIEKFNEALNETESLLALEKGCCGSVIRIESATDTIEVEFNIMRIFKVQGTIYLSVDIGEEVADIIVQLEAGNPE
jgi:hypothetical protein